MILDSVLPVFALIAPGAWMRRRGLTDPAFLRTGDRLVYYAVFAALLFWKIGGTPAAAAYSQATYRFNTYVAIAVVFAAQGDAGVARLDGLLAPAIPLCNVLSVVPLIWLSRESMDRRTRVRLTLRALVQNPLIPACVAGMLWARLLPASTAMCVLSGQLGSDRELSSAVIVLSTLASFVSLSVVPVVSGS